MDIRKNGEAKNGVKHVEMKNCTQMLGYPDKNNFICKRIGRLLLSGSGFI